MRRQLTSGLPPDSVKEDLLLTQWAVAFGKLNILKLLLQSRADVNKQNSKGATALCYAVEQNNYEAVKVLLNDDDIQVDKKTRNGWTPLLKACLTRYLNIAVLLLNKGADVNSQNNQGLSPLLDAVQKNHPDVVKLLLSQDDILVDLKTRKGLTPLQAACYQGYHSIAILLLNKGADVNAQKIGGSSSLLYAVQKNHPEVVKLLLDQDDILVDLKTSVGLTPLQAACYQGYRNIAVLLLDKGADVNAQMNGGFSPLYMAVQNKHNDVVELLLSQAGILVDLQIGSKGYSPLHLAALVGDIDMIKLLVEQGQASTSLKTTDGETPLQIAERKQHHKAAALLKRLG